MRQRFFGLGILFAESFWIAALVIAFWHHSPPIRDRWVWLLVFAAPIYALKALFFKKNWPWTPFDGLFIAFLIIAILNWQFAPYQRADFWVLISRPLMGMFIVWHFVGVARLIGSLKPLLFLTILLTTTIALLALTATQWHVKSVALEPIIRLLPTIPYRDYLPDAMLSFNPNEIAGALAWLCPLSLGLVFYPWGKMARGLSALGGGLALLALFLGQSRFALGGVLLAWCVGAWLLPQQTRTRALLLAVGVGFIALEGAILFNRLPFNLADSDFIGAQNFQQSSDGLSNRDETTFSTRFQIWESGLKMLRDYPLTGVGMSLFRSVARREPYIIPHYAQTNTSPPHAHNEWIDMGAEMGLLGLGVFIGWHLVAAYLLWQGGRSEPREARVICICVALGLMAHALFGIGDAIRIWDRFGFLFWWLLGLAAAQWTLYARPAATSTLQNPNNLKPND